MKRYDLMHQVNARGTFLTSKACIPHLKRAANPHVLMLSPPLDMSAALVRRPRRLHDGQVRHVDVRAGHGRASSRTTASPSTRSGRAPASPPPRSSSRWPATRACGTAARSTSWPTPPTRSSTSRRATCTGNFFIDDSLLYDEGERDFDKYRVDPTTAADARLLRARERLRPRRASRSARERA